MATYSTLNPSAKNSNITLSNGNLTATCAIINDWECVQGTIFKSSGKWYWEQTIAAGAVMVGLCNSSATTANGDFLGKNTNSWGYYNNGQKFTNNTGSAYGATWTAGDVIGIALDMDAGTITFYKNNTSQGTAFTGLTGSIGGGVSLYSNTSHSQTLNFGASAFTYSPPSGFNSGLFTIANTTITATQQSYAMTFKTAILRVGHFLVATYQTYAMTFRDAMFRYGKLLTATYQTYAVTFENAIITSVRHITADMQTYAVTFEDAVFKVGHFLVATYQTYAMTFEAVLFSVGRKIVATYQSYSVTLESAIFQRMVNMVATVQNYVVTFNPAIFLVNGYVIIYTNAVKHVSTWLDSTTKNVSTWINTHKS